MTANHLEILVEEPSMEAFLAQLLPRLLGERATFTLHVHQGKRDLLHKLRGRLCGYAKWLPETTRIVVLVDRDDDDCVALKQQIEKYIVAAGLSSRTASGNPWQVASRLAIEELESWFFGEWTAVLKAYPKASATIPHKATYREPDAIAGGTWEALERVMRNAGYFSGGFRKMEAANAIGKQFNPDLAKSPSFIAFRDVLLEAVS
jgi:hypothetical protein